MTKFIEDKHIKNNFNLSNELNFISNKINYNLKITSYKNYKLFEFKSN